MPHEVTSIANQFIQRGLRAKQRLTPMQVIKLTYIANGWMLGIHGESLVQDRVYAWRYGPVYLSLYFALRQYGRGDVTDLIPQEDPDQPYSTEEINIIDEVWRVYGSMGGLRLSNLTHAAGTPWNVTYHREGENAPIPDDLIKTHYEEKWRNL